MEEGEELGTKTQTCKYKAIDQEEDQLNSSIQTIEKNKRTMM